MDKKNINIDELKNVLVTKDVQKRTINGSMLKVNNYFFAKNPSDKSEKRGFYLDLMFDIFEVELCVDNTFYDTLEISDYEGVSKDWKYDMYFEYNGYICHAPLRKLSTAKGRFQSLVFVGLINQLRGVGDSLEIENYRQTMKNMREK